MYTIKNISACIAAMMLLLFSCKKDSEIFTIVDGSFGTNGLTASTGNLVLAQTNENNEAVKFSWPVADFGQKPVVTYTLQLTAPSDTSGANPWSKAKSIVVGNNILNYSFIVKDLNSLLNTMNFATGSPNDVVVRIKADVPQYNGAASTVPSIYSRLLVIKITSYSRTLYIPGDYQGWDPATAPELNQFEGVPGIYEAYVYMPATGTKYFKYTDARDWNHTNYGNGGSGTMTTDGAAAGMSVTNTGMYKLTANLNTNTWTATRITRWAIIGDATTSGWTSDLAMTYDVVNQVYKITTNLTAAGSFKFRANNAWLIDFGIDNTGKLVYSDNPVLPYNPAAANITVPANGNYTITLDLHLSQHYTYKIVKN